MITRIKRLQTLEMAKTITASDGEFVVDIPRDREGIFEHKVVNKV